MKKILTILLCLVCVMLLVSSCTSGPAITTEKEDASKIYNDAKEKTDALTSIKSRKVVKRSFSGDGNEFNDMSEIVITKNAPKKGSAQYLKTYAKSVNLTDGSENSISTSLYCVDNAVYEKTADGSKNYYYDTSNETVETQFTSIIPEFSKKTLKDSTVYTSKDEIEVVLNADAESIHALLHSSIEGINEYFTPEDNNGFAFEYSPVTIVFTISDGYIINITVTFDAEFSHKDGVSTVSTEIIWDVEDPGKDVTVEAPIDLGEYVLLTEETKTTETSTEQELLLAVQSLYDDFGNELPNFDELYAELCEQYTEEAVLDVINSYKQQF